MLFPLEFNNLSCIYYFVLSFPENFLILNLVSNYKEQIHLGTGIAKSFYVIRMDVNNYSVAFNISSEIQMVDMVIKEAEKFIDRFEFTESINLILILRELLINAVKHGNQNIPERIVMCRIEKLEESRFKIEVEDEGSGFDYGHLEMGLPKDPLHIKKRGYALINSLSDQIKFSSKGNRIIIYITLN